MARKNEEADAEDMEDKKPVVVDPPSPEEDDDGFESAPVKKERPTSDASEEDDDKDARFAYDDEDDEDSGGSSRRRRRNSARRAAAAQSQAVIGQLAGRVQQLEAVLSDVGRSQIGLAASEIESQMRFLQGKIREIDAAMARAIKDGNSDDYVQAQSFRDEARDRLQGLDFQRRRLAAEMQPAAAPSYAPPPAPSGRPQPDPRAVRLSERFMERHPWFDPEDLEHEESQMVVAIESALAAEGSNPATKKHWIELENRVRARSLGEEDGNVAKSSGGNYRPTAGRDSGGGRPAGTTRFTLTQEMKEALDAEGLLDEKDLTKEQRAQREKYVKTWKSGFEAAAKDGSLYSRR